MSSNSSTERLASFAEGKQPRWSTSTTTTTPELGQRGWEIPPVPPIPDDRENLLAWKQRSLKRSSLTSFMSGGDFTGPQGDSEKRAMRPRSASTTSTAVQRSRANAHRREKDPHADLHWDANVLNPQNWSTRKRWLHTLLAIGVTFAITMASSITALAQEEFMDRFNISTTLAELPFAIFVLGLAFGPLISRPISEMFGRKVIFMTFFLLFAIFTLATGLIQTSYGLIVCRALAGLFASPALSVGCEILSDIWKARERSLPLLLYYCTLFLGPAVGMILGGYITQHEDGRWTQYVIVFACVVLLAPICLISETSKTLILRRKNAEPARALSSSTNFQAALLDPLRLLLLRPVVLLLGLYSGFSFGVLYASFVAFPRVFSDGYMFDLGTQGLTFVSMMLGLLTGLVILVFNHKAWYKPQVLRWQQERANEVEKALRAKRRTNRSSRASTRSRPGTSRSRRLTIGTATPSVDDNERNVSLAVAAANHLNSLPANEGRCIMPERIQMLLSRNLPFGNLCETLEGYNLRLDRVQLAKALVDALHSSSNDTGITKPGTAHACPPALVRSKSMHRQAAVAAFDASTAPPPDVPAFAPPAPQRSTLKVQAQNPPAKWRLVLACPASILLAGSLFLFGWTARKSIHWVPPCIAMGIFAFSTLIVFASIHLYIMDRYNAEDGPSALAGSIVLRYLLSFTFVLFAAQLYEKLGVAWASSIFAFISMALGVIPWVLVLRTAAVVEVRHRNEA